MNQQDGELLVISEEPPVDLPTGRTDIADLLAGRLTHLYPDPEETRRFLAQERASWDVLDAAETGRELALGG